MTTFYAICAVIGGTILLVQFALTLLGLSDGGHDFDAGGHDVALDGAGDASADQAAGHDADHSTHGSNWLFGVISFRTLVAALTFFGLAGLAADAGEMAQGPTFIVALIAGGAAMYGVYWLMQGLSRLRADGTVRIQTALGRTGTVYIRIPPGRAGQGKVHLNLQNQTMELQAVTTGESELPTGATIVVTQIVGPDTVEVARAS